jgi:hypothetical protein
MCVARDCRTMLLSIDGDQYEAPESPAHVVASSLPALHLLVCASNSEPCQPCVFHNLPCLPLQSLCMCATWRRRLSCLLLTLPLSIPPRPESVFASSKLLQRHPVAFQLLYFLFTTLHTSA